MTISATKSTLKGLTLDIVKNIAEIRKHQFASPNLLDVAVANTGDSIAGLIDETITANPELTVIPARSISGVNFKTLVRTALPGVAFRDANEGMASTKGTYQNRLIETFILNPRWDCDKAVADRYEDGAEAYLALEASGILEAAMQVLCEQFYYGTIDTTIHSTEGDSKGFNGLHSQIGVSAANNILVDAGGTTGSTGSSVFMVRGGKTAVQWVWGAGGQLKISEAREESILDSGSAYYTAYVQELLAYPGLQVGSNNCIGRIGELTEDANCTLTDEMMANLYSQFPTGSKPTALFMSRRSQRQLRDSRTWAE